MEQNIPSWLNEGFLKAVLQGESEERTLSVSSFNATSAVLGGQNIASHIFRVEVQYEIDSSHLKATTSLIVKMPITVGLDKTSEDSGFSGKEHKVYHSILPILDEKLNCEFGPATFFCPSSKCLVLEDLITDGYVMHDEFNRLDFLHCKKVLETIAKFHAGSVLCFKENPHLIEIIGEDILWAKGCMLRPWMTSAVKTILEIVSVMDGCDKFTNFLTSRVDHLWESIVKISNSKPTGFNVLNHGDLWFNNILFKYDDLRNIEDIKLIDFQITKFAPPVLDLINFIWTSGNEEVRGSSQPELYRFYLQVLNSSLEQIDCEERYSIDDLRADLREATDWGVLMICCALPVITAPSEDALDVGKLSFEDFGTNKFTRIYKGKHLTSILQTVVKQFTDFFLNDKLLLSEL